MADPRTNTDPFRQPGQAFGRSPTNFGDVSQTQAQAGAGALSLFGQGTDILKGGQIDLQPVISYLSKLVSGDPQALAEATQPETIGILSQYDTARKAIAERTPRGGGRTSAIAGSYVSEGAQIAGTRAKARTSAVGELAAIGQNQEQLGLGAEGAGLQGFLSLISSALEGQKQDRSLWSDIGKGIAGVIPFLL